MKKELTEFEVQFGLAHNREMINGAVDAYRFYKDQVAKANKANSPQGKSRWMPSMFSARDRLERYVRRVEVNLGMRQLA